MNFGSVSTKICEEAITAALGVAGLLIVKAVGIRNVGKTLYGLLMDPWFLDQGYECVQLSQLRTQIMCASLGMLQVNLNKLYITNITYHN